MSKPLDSFTTDDQAAMLRFARMLDGVPDDSPIADQLEETVRRVEATVVAERDALKVRVEELERVLAGHSEFICKKCGLRQQSGEPFSDSF